MNERIRKFYDKNKDSSTFYEDVTKKEFDALQYYYRKEKYMMGHQHIYTSTYNASDIIAESSIPEEHIFRDEETDVEAEAIGAAVLEEMLASLTDEEREVVTLCTLGGYTDREAAEIMKKHESSLRRCRLRALKKMRAYLKKAGFEDYSSAKGIFSKNVISKAVEKVFPIVNK